MIWKDKVIRQYEEIAKTYSSFDTVYNLLIKTNDITICKFCLDKDGIWKRIELKWMIEHFEKLEQYDKCEYLKDIMNNNYIADDLKQIELNEKLEQYYKQN